MVMIAYKYGALWPKDWGEDCTHQLRMQTELWNMLAKIHRETGETIRSLTPSTDELKLITTRLIGLRDEISQLMAKIKAGKIERHFINGKKVLKRNNGNTSEEVARLRDLRNAVKETSQKRAALAKQARNELVADQVIATYDQQHIKIKGARRAAATRGLWWGNYNAVMASFDGARSRVAKTGGNISEKHFRGEGRLTVQIQGGATSEEMFSRTDTCGRNEARLVDGTPPGWEDRRTVKNQTPPTPDSKRSLRRRLVTLVLTVYTSRDEHGRLTRRVIHVPLIYDRPLPADGIIQQIVMTRRRGDRFPTGDWRYDVIFTLRIPQSAARVADRKAAVHIGWRTVEHGVRVATVADQNGISYLVLPTSLASRFEAAGELLSATDIAADAMRCTVLGWPLSDAPTTVKADLESVRRARSGAGAARSMHWLARNWLTHASDYRADILAVLRIWAGDDISGRWRARNTQSKAVRHRRDLVRVWVAGLSEQYDRVIVQQYDVSRLRHSDLTAESLASGRRNIQRMAPGEVRANVISTLTRRGVDVIMYEGKVTWVCSYCGVESAPSDPLALRLRCPHCSACWDVDDNAARNALAVLIEDPEKSPSLSGSLRVKELEGTNANRFNKLSRLARRPSP